MLKKLLIGLFLLGMLCGAGFVSAGSYSTSTRVTVQPTGDEPATNSVTFKSIVCGGSC